MRREQGRLASTAATEPYKAHILTAPQMAAHGAALARQHKLAQRQRGDALLTRLTANARALQETNAALAATVVAGKPVTPAGEWLLDNFYLIEEEIRLARRLMPLGYSRALPQLESGVAAGLPRVYDLALQVIAHSDSCIDVRSLSGFIDAYQRLSPLKLGELWAIPIMLRLALIENLRRVGARIAQGNADRRLANRWADAMQEAANTEPADLILLVADMARSGAPMTSAFVAELARRLQANPAVLGLPLTWVEQHLASSGQTIDELVQVEIAAQASAQLTVSNSINSLRLLDKLDWSEFVETLSVVEHELHADPADIYAQMDFATRDTYRHAVERLARLGTHSEREVARAAIELAREAAANPSSSDRRRRHVGYYLVDRGLQQLEQVLGVRKPWPLRLRRIAARMPLAVYLGPITLISAGTALTLFVLGDFSAAPLTLQMVLGTACLLAASHLAVGIVNWAVTLCVMPKRLPRMNYAGGIPQQKRTLVVVPTMLDSAAGLESLIESLEIRFLGNRDPSLHFALLTDFRDAASQHMPGDEELLELARERIEELNRKYPSGASGSVGHSSFFLLHRPRSWNVQEGIWMGRERKRGKLEDLNALLRGVPDAAQRFSLIVGDVDLLGNVRFVITLDTDTQLPRDAAREMIATMAHPLNQPRFRRAREGTAPIVAEGYGILQPRVEATLAGSASSRRAWLFGGSAGIDPYTRTVSDVYQDLFGEGSFIGKGIYDVDALERVLAGRFPENRILSHDLLEGCFTRSGLLSDVTLYEEHPASYAADVGRRHRWTRGDWQLLPWILPWLRKRNGSAARWRRNPLSALSRWKLFDNLRRSLVPASVVILAAAIWLLSTRPLAATLALLGVLLAPKLAAWARSAVRKPPETSWRQHLAPQAPMIGRSLLEYAFRVAALPHEAYWQLDAIVRSLWRMTISKRRLLEWTPSSDLADGRAQVATFQHTWIAPLAAVVIAAMLAASPGVTLLAAFPVLLAWLGLPAFVRWLDQPPPQISAAPGPDETLVLRALARRTWGYFDRFVGPEDHWLPPDNHQEHPVARTAPRTSPTNMGMALLANLAAHDFGYLVGGELLERCGNTLDTMLQLPRYRGHFYNWYDTHTLAPLRPAYVSTVDSGNLAGFLVVLASGLQELAQMPILGVRWLEGLADTRRVLREAGEDGCDPRVLAAFDAALERACAAPPTTLAAAWRCVDELATQAQALQCLDTGASAATVDAAKADEAASAEAAYWIDALARQSRCAREELRYLTPWAGELSTGAEADIEIPSLQQLADGVVDPPLGTETCRRARERLASIERRVSQARALARMDFAFLFDESRKLLTIGYNVEEHQRDEGRFDLLASEARLGCFIAIAQGQLPVESWFSLGRTMVTVARQPALASWSGSMFEYLMPMLVMPSYRGSLLDQSCRAAVARHIEYGRQRGVPWGISESGYYGFDGSFNYQYRPFGAPGLGLKRGLAADLVVAPYATVMALMVAPAAAFANLQRLAREGERGRFGFYEAIDYTKERLPRGARSAVVRSFMVHHQGMALLALLWRLLDQPMQRRFEADPEAQTTLLLLQERMPRPRRDEPLASSEPELLRTRRSAPSPTRVITSVDTPVPEVQLLSNGRYHVMVTHAGGGYSRWLDLAVTRWQEDATRDHWGSFCYIRDVRSGRYWSSAHQPTGVKPLRAQTIFTEGRVEFRRRDAIDAQDADIDTHTEIVVSQEDDIELRRVHITNLGRTPREIEVTSYSEVVLAPPASDAAHPAFSKLFLQTERLEHPAAILCTRRSRETGERSPWMFHQMVVREPDRATISYETDRAAFIGRGNSVAAPAAMQRRGPLAGGVGSVLDPIVAGRSELVIAPGQTATIDLVTGIAGSRDTCIALALRYKDKALADRVFDMAWTHGQVVLRQLNASEADAQLYARLAGAILYANARMRAEASVLLTNRRAQSGLWGHSISGDLPIVLLRMSAITNLDLVRQVLQAHAWWRLKGLIVDLVIWNEDNDVYRQELHERILGLVSGPAGHPVERPGGVFVRHTEHMPRADRVLLQSVARVIINDRKGSLADQLEQALAARAPAAAAPRAIAGSTRSAPPAAFAPTTPSTPSDLRLFNGIGGFSADGREYVIAPADGLPTPAPWSNVLANPRFGSVVSDIGSAYTWFEDAHAWRLTPWCNDPLTDDAGEAIFLRDDDNALAWSPAGAPLDGSAASRHMTRHGFGYSTFEHIVDGIESELTVFVAVDAPIKFWRLRVRNRSGRARRLSAIGYVEWVLGDLRALTSMHIVTEIDRDSGAVLARNSYHPEFSAWVAFFDGTGPQRSVTADRTEFIGRHRSLRNPAALGRVNLSGKVGAGLDPCAAIQTAFELAEGEEQEIVFKLGAGRQLREARELLRRFAAPSEVDEALAAVHGYWSQTLGRVQVRTPEPELDLLVNGWLVYQALACRYWARSGYYQSSGAYGFRDQLQDVMALVHARPELLREHLIRSAGRQFVEGDVQHWWRPSDGRGVRTHCSDDYLWLPLALCRYVEVTGDSPILDEVVPFLEGPPVPPGEESWFDLPATSRQSASLYQHAVRAIEHGLRFGARGLPLMGGGDWNDGMNLVGLQGRGESVWLGFFMCEVLRRFAALAHSQGDEQFAQRCQHEREQLAHNLERHGWDGGWWRRAYFDDGTPLGSASNVECQIDSISQSWSVLSGVGSAERARQAMQALDARLVRREQGLVQLLDPPFDTAEPNPGYIRSYVPGVRENGGQYTHAAIWAAMAFAARGDHERAWDLWRIIQPIGHARDLSSAARYKLEPYVVSADVYWVAPHTGRGGWSWYTGSAGWLLRFALESLLGLRRTANRLTFEPCLPPHWPSFELVYRQGTTSWRIEVTLHDNPRPAALTLDGVLQSCTSIALVEDGKEHEVQLALPRRRDPDRALTR